MVAYGRVDSGLEPMSEAKQKPLKWSIEREGLNRVLATPSTGGETIRYHWSLSATGWAGNSLALIWTI
jgi:hypothetical protein